MLLTMCSELRIMGYLERIMDSISENKRIICDFFGNN